MSGVAAESFTAATDLAREPVSPRPRKVAGTRYARLEGVPEPGGIIRASTLIVLSLLVPLAALTTACEETDVPATGGEGAPGQELEAAIDEAVEPVDLQAQPWFRESGMVEFGGRA